MSQDWTRFRKKGKIKKKRGKKITRQDVCSTRNSVQAWLNYWPSGGNLHVNSVERIRHFRAEAKKNLRAPLASRRWSNVFVKLSPFGFIAAIVAKLLHFRPADDSLVVLVSVIRDETRLKNPGYPARVTSEWYVSRERFFDSTIQLASSSFFLSPSFFFQFALIPWKVREIESLV